MTNRPDPQEGQALYRPWSDVRRDLLMIGVPFLIFVAFGQWLSFHVLWFVERFNAAYFKIAYLLMLEESPQLLEAEDGYATAFFIWMWVLPAGLSIMVLADCVQRVRRYLTDRE